MGKNLISVPVGIGEDLKQEQGAMNKESSENKKRAWRLNTEWLKFKRKRKIIQGLENKVNKVLQKEKEKGGEMMRFRRQRSNICLMGASERENKENRGEKCYQRNNTRKSPGAEDLALQLARA